MCIRDRYQRRVHGENQTLMIIYLVVYLILFALVQGNILKCVFTEPGQVFPAWSKENLHRANFVKKPQSKKKFLEKYPELAKHYDCLLYTSPSPRDLSTSRMPSSA
eukprot:TRINITY_DN67553_c0_g1_i1.p4 TRINITY_DN67553_c0_g1~~TRINITY_DN67553_c0_g1_i1.p4  ORF type:complete len:106 (+),score=28.40 TRINITY_DN67553_c0_g1_i1:148-465(+)